MGLYKITSALFALTLSTGVNAELIDYGNYITDTEAGLDWLKLTETKGMSYDQVEAQLETDGQFSGWVFASKPMITSFLDNAGGSGNYESYIALPDGGVMPNNPASLLPFLNMWGDMSVYDSLQLNYGQRLSPNTATIEYGLINIYGYEGFFSAYPETSQISLGGAFIGGSSWEGSSITNVLVQKITFRY